MHGMVTLTPAESKRLIAKGIAALQDVIEARSRRTGRIIIAGGTTNAFIAEEIMGEKVHKSEYTAGIVCEGLACTTPQERRLAPIALVDGKPVTEPWTEVLKGFQAGDVFIKGANAVDPMGNGGVLVAAPNGGTIGQAIGTVLAQGAHLIMAVGMEKLVPDVIVASRMMGISRLERSIGLACGLFPVSGGRVFTEIQSFSTLFGVKAVHVASGGVGGSEGSVVMALEGEPDAVNAAMDLVASIKGEEPVPALKGDCNTCRLRCDRATGK